MPFISKIIARCFVACRYLFGYTPRSGRYLWGAIAGIALSLVPIMITLIVTDGMIRGITDRFLELGTGHIQIRSYGEDAVIEDIIPTVESFPGVRGVWSEIQGIGIVLGKTGKTGSTIRATTPSYWEDPGSLKYLRVISGEAEIKSANEVLLGERLAQIVGAEIGQPVRIMTVRTTEDGRNIPRTRVFTVRGIVSSGYHEIDAMWCLISFEAGKRLFEGELTDPFLVVKADNPYTDVDVIAGVLNWQFQGSFQALTWKQIQPLQYNSYEQTRQLLLFIMALIVLVATVNVSSAISMFVIERQHDIAILKAMGIGQNGTASIFLLGGFLTGFTGAITGVSAGLVIGTHINGIVHNLEVLINIGTAFFHQVPVKILDPGFYLEKIPITIHWNTVIGIGIFTVICSVLASAIPARHAGNARPVDLLRKH